MIACEQSVEQYLQTIRSIPRLTPEQEARLAAKCAAGDAEAVRKMVDSNLRLVVSIAGGYAQSGVPLLDLIQEGSMGLLVAAKKFDPAMNCRFSTYATKWIRHGVTRCIMKHSGLIRVSQRTAEKAKKIRAAQAALEDPTVEAIAAYCKMEPEQVEKTLALLPEVLSIDDDTARELLEDISAPQPYEDLVRQELKNTMDGLLSQLTQRQQQVLRLRFGMADGECHTQESIGKLLGISKERARQIENEAVKKLQKLSQGLGLEDFLDP